VTGEVSRLYSLVKITLPGQGRGVYQRGTYSARS